MKKLLIVLAALAALFILWVIPSYNGIVNLDEKVSGKWADVESQYQRRSDLIPNLVATVKGYADHEKSTLDAVASARAQASQMKVDIGSATPEQLAQFEKLQGSLSSAVSRLMAIAESYPELKANEHYLELQAQLEGTENRITVARRDFNAAVREYNTSIRHFPSSLVAGIFGFDSKAYFEADAGADKAPEVEF